MHPQASCSKPYTRRSRTSPVSRISRLRAQADAGRAESVAGSSAAAPTRRASKTSSGAPTMDDDELMYEVDYRREGDTTWKVPRKNVVLESIIVWDTTTVPNGTYFVRVIASDAASNSEHDGLDRRTRSNAFDIDNAPPVFSGCRTHRRHAHDRVGGRARRPVGDSARRYSRRTAKSGQRSFRLTASPTRSRSTTTSASTAASARAASHFVRWMR